MKTKICMIALCSFLVLSQTSLAAQDASGLPEYQKASGVSGNLNSIGSDTLNNLMTYWAEGFQALYPNVRIQVEGKGSSTAPPALIEGTAQLGPMSRQMKNTEQDEFEKKYGYKSTEVRVAIDALAVFVHKDNPIPCLTLQQLDSAFSSTLKRGGRVANTWGDLGADPSWKEKPLSLYGRNSASGTYGYFKEVALEKGDYQSTVKEQPGSSSVVQGVANDIKGIGYSGIGYKTSGVKALQIKGEDGQCYDPSLENSISGKYPLARFLYVYVNKKPGTPTDKLVGEFLKFVESRPGQTIVAKDGYFPLPSSMIEEEITKLSR